jgi:hypothetical protein
LVRRLGIVVAVGVVLTHGACSSTAKTVATGGSAGTGGEDASSDARGGASGQSGGQAGTLTGGSSGALSYEDLVLSDGPSLYWRELAGFGSVVDVSPKRNDGSHVGCVEPREMGSQATIHLCGGYLYAEDIFDFADRAPFTFEAWIRPESVQLARFARIAGKENPVVGPRLGWNLILAGGEDDGGTPALFFERWFLGDGSAINSGVIRNNPTLPSDGFTHLAVTYDSAACRIYLNGVSAAEGPSTASIADTTSTFRVGADAIGEHIWLGEIDEIAVYERALLPGRIAAHYDQGKAEGY